MIEKNLVRRIERIESHILLLNRAIEEVRRELERMESGVPDPGWIEINLAGIQASALAIHYQTEELPC